MTETTLLITFDIPLSLEEVPWFRGCILKTLDAGEEQVMMHNHQGENFRYSYPLVQYKSIGGRAAIMCIGKGVEMSGKIMNVCNRHVVIGQRHEIMTILSVLPMQTDVAVGGPCLYRLSDWLPFNERNHNVFQSILDGEERIAFLESLLVGNILSMAKGLDIFFDEQVECEITSINRYRLVTCKGVEMQTFDLEFLSNVHLPEYAGLGKHVSFGYGQVSRV